MPECSQELSASSLAFINPAEGDLLSLAFVPGEAGVEDLVLGSQESAYILRNFGPAVPQQITTELAPAWFVAGADFVGDGQAGIALAGPTSADAITFWQPDATDGFLLTASVGAPGDPAALHGADRSGESADLILVTATGDVYRYSTDSAPGEQRDNLDLSVADLAVGDFDGDGIDELAAVPLEGGAISVHTLEGEYTTQTGIPGRPGRTLVVGEGVEGDRDDLFSVTPLGDWMAVERLGNPLTGEGRAQLRLSADPAAADGVVVAAGTIDANRSPDLVVLENQNLKVVLFDARGPTCQASLPLPDPRTLMDVGFFSDRLRIALADGQSFELLELFWD